MGQSASLLSFHLNNQFSFMVHTVD